MQYNESMTLHTIFDGRMNRRNFIMAQLILATLSLILIVVVLEGEFSLQALIDKNKELQTILLFLAPVGLLFQFVCSFRRLHDINQSGLWALLLLTSLVFIPLVDIALLVYLAYKKGDVQINQYGNPDTRNLIDSLMNR